MKYCKLPVLFLLFIAALFFLFPLIVSADFLYTCKPVQNKEEFLNRLLNDSNYSNFKKWGNYKFKVEDCYVSKAPRIDEPKQEYVIIKGFYYTPPEISNYKLSYAVNLDVGLSVPVSSGEILVDFDEQFLIPAHIQNIIHTIEIDPRAKEFIQTFGANDSYINRWYIILRNKDSRFNFGCERCGTGLTFKPNLYNGIKGFGLPVNKAYKEFPEISYSLSIIEKGLKSGCVIDKESNIIVWISTPPTPREVEVQTKGQGCETQIEIPGFKIKAVSSFRDQLSTRQEIDAWDKDYITDIITPTKTPTPTITKRPTNTVIPIPTQPPNIFVNMFNWIKTNFLHL